MEKHVDIKNISEFLIEESDKQRYNSKEYNDRDDKDNRRKKITMNLDIKVPVTLFDVDFRINLINFIKRQYESRVYYMFYIDKIDYSSILENELPLIKLRGSDYVSTIPLDMEIIYFKKGDVVSLKLILDNNTSENKINVFGENTYISCKINLNNNQIIEAGHQKAEAVKDNTYNKIYKRGDNIQVKITGFFNNQLQNGFGSRINCEGSLL